MKKVNNFIVQMAVVAIPMIFLIGTASAGCIGDETGTDFGCGDTVNESCTFNGDMSCSSGHGLIVGANGITIDGNGYTLDGVSSDACDGFEVQRSGIYGKSCSDIVIKDLEIKNFCNGIYFRYTEDDGIPLERITIENCDIHHNGGDTGGDNSVHGIKAIGVFDSVIKNCKIHDNIGKGDSCEGGGNGIFLKGISGYGAWGNIITENEIYDNKKGGFFTKMMCKDTEVSYNKLWGNGQGGIILRCMKSATHDIQDNEIWDNYGSGIFVGGPDNTIRDNIVKNNKNGSEYGGLGTGEHGGPGSGSPGKYGMGICMGRNDGSHNNEIISNEVCGNEGVDIEVCPTCEGNSGEENTCDTTLNYNDDGICGCTYDCPAFAHVFDTGKGTYPSIFGTHRGKIIPDKDITVNKMYTYPCKGTGGHTEYVKIWNESEGIEGEGNWSGYQGDYHNITISPTITLLKNHAYNYTIRTGSYPQIIHEPGKEVTGGTINCTEFVDANGMKYTNRIPAIRLWAL